MPQLEGFTIRKVTKEKEIIKQQTNLRNLSSRKDL